MKRFIVLVGAALALSAPSSDAQTWQDGAGSYNLNSCIRVNTKADTKTVKCTADYTYTGNSDKSSVYFFFNQFKLIDPEGKESSPLQAVASSGGFSTANYFGLDVYKSLPIKVTLFFDYPLQYVSIARLVFANKVFSNVPIRGAVTTTPKLATTTTVTTPPNNPTAAPVGKFSISLSNCTPAAGGTYTCTGAVLTPSR